MSRYELYSDVTSDADNTLSYILTSSISQLVGRLPLLRLHMLNGAVLDELQVNELFIVDKDILLQSTYHTHHQGVFVQL